MATGGHVPAAVQDKRDKNRYQAKAPGVARRLQALFFVRRNASEQVDRK
jgi:hypothetical protein